jgi:hypothetical protein
MTLHRTLARIGAGVVGLLAAGSFAAPALADTTADLEIKASGTTIAADAAGKFGTLSLINNGPSDATGITLTLDISELDTDVVDTPIDLIEDLGCNPREGDTIVCGFADATIPAGADIDFPLPLVRAGDATGPAGQLTATLKHEGTDPQPENNTVTVDVRVNGNGVDLAVIAEDVRNEINLDESTSFPAFTEELIHPGDTAAVVGFAINQGDMTAKGVKVSVTLPRQVTFAEKEEGCTYSADNRTVTCNYAQVSLIPVEKDTDENDDASAFAVIWFPITVAEGVTAPVALTGGTFGVAALGQVEFEEEASTLSAPAPPKLPANVKLLNSTDVPDVDPSDNEDGFSVFVAAEGGAGGGGGLPVTGVQAGLIGGIGAVVIAVGGVLLLITRRRRVVLITPGDETPTS